MQILIVIDMQKKYMPLYDSGLVERVNARILAARQEGTEIVYVNNPGAAADSETYGFAEGLEVFPEHVFHKKHQSVMTSPEFVQFLEDKAKEAGIIELIGADGRVCVAQSALDLAACGYRVRVNLSCVGAKDDPFYRLQLKKMKEAGVELT